MKSAKAVAAAVGTIVASVLATFVPDMPPGTVESLQGAVVAILVWLVPNATGDA